MSNPSIFIFSNQRTSPYKTSSLVRDFPSAGYTDSRRFFLLNKIALWRFFIQLRFLGSKMVPGILERFKDRFDNKTPDSFCGDRGFSSPTNSKLLEKENVFNAICPKSVKELTQLLKENTFRVKLKRRGPNEARGAIFKNKFSKVALRVSPVFQSRFILISLSSGVVETTPSFGTLSPAVQTMAFNTILRKPSSCQLW